MPTPPARSTPVNDPQPEDELRSDRLFHLILEHMGDLVAVVDLQGRRLYNSPSYEQALGGDPGGLRGSDSFAEIHPEDRTRVRAAFERTVATGVGQRAEYRLLHRDGRTRYIESQGDVIRGADGAPSRVVIVSRDITERKLAEAQLLQSEKLSSLGQMAAGLAHELKNPLSVILQAAEFLEANTTLDADGRECATLVGESAERADKIIQRALRFSRPAALVLAPADLASVVRSALAMVKQQVLSVWSKMTVVTELPADLPKALLDEQAMLQVLINLCVNAIQAMPGKGTLTVRGAVATLAEPSPGVGDQPGDMFKVGARAVICEIRDTGSGIPKASLDKIFEPFFTTKPPGEGTGLGLPIVRTIVQEHRGLIRVESEEGRGTTFRIFLQPAGAA